MNLQNIGNVKSKIYMFIRNNDGSLSIKEDETFKPYFYEYDPLGDYKTYDGKRAIKIEVEEPKLIKDKRSDKSYEADILYPKRYIIDKISQFTKSLIKYLILDIEIQAPELPNVEEAKYPISSISIYNSFTKKTENWNLLQMSENDVLNKVTYYIKKESPDLITGWNVNDFDFPYLCNRIPRFAERISPIEKVRYGKGNTFYPQGISIVDFMGLYDKFTLGKRRAYSLEHICHDDLGKEYRGQYDFSKIDKEVIKKNIQDVEWIEELNQKFKVLDYFDEVRRFCRVFWEDLPITKRIDKNSFQKVSNNSKLIDMLVLAKAKEMNIVLPTKHFDPNEDSEYEGAFREIYKKGRLFNIAKTDLGSAYPNMAIDFAIDSSNFVDKPEENTIKVDIVGRVSNQVENTYYIKQNSNALLPSVLRDLIQFKDKLKNELKKLDPSIEEYKNLKIKYNSIKGIVNSAYGSCGNRYFRLYDMRVVEAITFLVRDLLHYVIKKFKEEKNIDIVYVDTDSAFYDSKENYTKDLNDYIKEWGIKKYDNDKVSIEFDFEGFFEKIFLSSKCHYLGYLRSKTGIEEEKKGLKLKRNDSSKYEAKFQKELFNKILNNETEDNIINWVKKEVNNLSMTKIEDVMFPCKITERNYKNNPIFCRAYNNSKKFFPQLEIGKGELFHYVFVKSLGKDENGKPIDVLAISDKVNFNDLKNYIDWDRVVERNIVKKVDEIFEVLNWNNIRNCLSGQETLF